MNIKMLAFLAVASCCLGFSVPSLAGQELDAIDMKVEQRSVEIDQKYGVLLDSSERADLKLDLIAKKALSDAADGQAVKDIADNANSVYEITDPYEQRKLLIKIEAQAAVQKEGTGGGGQDPEYP